MPQLEFRMPGLPQGITIEAKLEVKYERGNGARHPSRTDKDGNTDTVKIPENGEFKTNIAGDTWQIWNEYPLQTEGFFGGDATLTYKLKSGANEILAPQTIKFRIGGRNPEPERARAYIETLQDAGPQGNLWFSYAIAKHESRNYNGDGTRYNQFLELPRDANDNSYRQMRTTHAGRPLFGNDPSGPGGYGMFQVTGNAQSELANIPREQIWNWQRNAEAALVILRSKYQGASQAMAARRQECLNERGQNIPIPNHSVPRGAGDAGTLLGDPIDGGAPNPTHTFTDTDGTAAVAIKRNNGAAVIAPGHTTGTGDYIVWRNTTAQIQGRWEFRRWRVVNGQVIQVSYVDLVAEEFE